MKTPDELFQGSIDHYQELIRGAEDLYDNMASLSPDMILERCNQLRQLLKEQKETDKFILDIMLDIGPSILDTPYIGEYQRVLDNAKQYSDKVASKARILRTLLQSEIEKLKHGQKSLAGYTAATKTTSYSLNNRC